MPGMYSKQHIVRYCIKKKDIAIALIHAIVIEHILLVQDTVQRLREICQPLTAKAG